MELYYCGFNGFGQVPSCSASDTLTTLTQHNKSSETTEVIDVAICWNYLVVAESTGVTKYGLVNNKPAVEHLRHPPGAGKVTQISATPRHILGVTDSGECWTNEEGKGWRRVLVCPEAPPLPSSTTPSEETVSTVVSEDEVTPGALPEAGSLSLAATETASSQASSEASTELENEEEAGGCAGFNVAGAASCLQVTCTGEQGQPDNCESPVAMVSTACGDYHNLGVDREGQAYSLPTTIAFDSFPGGAQQKVVQVAAGKEHCMLLTEHGQVYSWGGGTRGQLGHGTLASEETPRLIMALDGMRIVKIAAGGWHSAAISEFHDLYVFGWNESGQLAQQTNLARPAECFSAVEKLLMACCTMQAEDAAVPRGDTEDTEVYRKHGDKEETPPLPDCPEKEALNCYNSTSCDNNTDYVMVQSLPMLVQVPGKTSSESAVVDVGCGSRHTVCLTKGNNLWSFGWNKYGQLGLGDTKSRDAVVKMVIPPKLGKQREVSMLRCGDWGTAILAKKLSK